MIKTKISLKIHSFLIIMSLAFSTWCYAATKEAQSPSYDHVVAAISNADPGDVVIVPAGSGDVTWDKQLIIDKGITLKGPGANNLTITGNYTAPSPSSYNGNSEDFLIAYAPSNPAAREAFRLTGFTIKTGGKSHGLQLFNRSAYTPSTMPNKIRIDHNVFDTSGKIVMHVKGMWGVIDNNTFNNSGKIANEYLNSVVEWNNLSPFEYGSANHMYIEDNTFNVPNNTLAIGTGYSGEVVVRYNDFNYSSTLSNWSVFDIHNLDPLYYGGIGAEVYGNNVQQTSSRTCQYISHRGGKLLFFYNYVTSSPSIAQLLVRQEDPASSLPPSESSQPYIVSDSYYFNNRHGAGNLELGEEESNDWNFSSCCGELQENRDFFRYNETCTSLNCSSGVGIGSAIPTGACTTGVGYWRTDQGAGEVTDYVGVNPTTPISGTLYKCTATNTWTAYYTPYTYPHPLITGISGLSSPGGGKSVIY